VSLPHIRDGKVRALAVTSPKPSSVAPDIPTLSQFVPGYESLTWFGVFGPAGLPAAIQDKLNQALNKAIQNPALLAQFAKLGFDAAGGTPAEFAKKMADETVMWRKVITDGNITIEK
jgi:tripartite-type tricarboxylate transporter receptor subunit TctC